jgi:predicted outer membrane protein
MDAPPQEVDVRVIHRLGVVTAGVLAALAAVAAPAAAAPVTPAQLNATDMALLNGVRLAGLWEMPAGQMAAGKGDSIRVREIGAEIARQHAVLDELDVDAANKLGASIPATPTAQQQGWLAEMQNAKGRQFDQIFVTRLRAAHGKIFPVIGAVRSSTRNPIIRKLADQANTFVLNHMKMLESTGLVQYEKLPPAAMPPAEDLSTMGLASANAGVNPPVNPTVLWTILIGVAGLGCLASLRLYRSRG